MFHGRVSYFADMIAAPLAAFWLSADAASQFNPWQLTQCLAFMLFGICCWTLVEYLMHRFLYHGAPVARDYHLVHHTQSVALVSSPPLLGTGLILIAAFVMGSAISLEAAYGTAVGILIGYAVYMAMHHGFHHWRLGQRGWLYNLRRHHMLHHRQDNCNFGVTTAFWDMFFGTVYRYAGAHPLHASKEHPRPDRRG